MNICILGSLSGGYGAANREVAEGLREAGHTVSFLPGFNNPANRVGPLLASFMQPRLEEALFQYDAVLAGGDNLDYPRITRAMRDRPVLIVDGDNAESTFAQRRLPRNAVLLCKSEGDAQRAEKVGFERTVTLSRANGPDALKEQLSEALEPVKGRPAVELEQADVKVGR